MGNLEECETSEFLDKFLFCFESLLGNVREILLLNMLLRVFKVWAGTQCWGVLKFRSLKVQFPAFWQAVLSKKTMSDDTNLLCQYPMTVRQYTVFTQIRAMALIKFFGPQMQCFEGSAYLRAAFI